MSDLLDAVELETGTTPQWSVVWLHGLGADGNDFAPIVPELVRPGWPSLRFVFPHAPVRPITINNGLPMRAWYDIAGMDFASRVDAAGLEVSIAQIEALIEREAERGVAASQVLLAGFSQGGAITLAAGVRRRTPLAGLIALSTYLPGLETLPSVASEVAKTQPVFMGHGTSDPVVLPSYGQRSAQALSENGFSVDWHTYPMAHSVCAEEIRDLGDWMSQRLSQAIS